MINFADEIIIWKAQIYPQQRKNANEILLVLVFIIDVEEEGNSSIANPTLK